MNYRNRQAILDTLGDGCRLGTFVLRLSRPGRQPTHKPEVRSALIALATQKPNTLGYPFKLWTLERLQRAFEERNHTHLSDSTIWEWLDAEGLEWKRQESWFHEAAKHDPEFVEKRGAS